MQYYEAGQKIWFTSDHHFGHANIIKHCNRPFPDADTMNAEMIKRWNEVVAREDIVYHLGDLFSFKPKEMDLARALTIRNQLNGKLWLLRGNHDVQSWLQNPILRIDGYFLPPYVDFVVVGKRRLQLCHYPMEEWEGREDGVIHLHGHTHGRSRIELSRFDVGVDMYDFRPVSLEQILDGGYTKSYLDTSND